MRVAQGRHRFSGNGQDKNQTKNITFKVGLTDGQKALVLVSVVQLNYNGNNKPNHQWTITVKDRTEDSATIELSTDITAVLDHLEVEWTAFGIDTPF